MSWLFGKKKLKLKKRKKVEEPVLQSIGEDNLDLNDEELVEIAEEVRVKKKKPIITKIPKGKALVNTGGKSYLHLILGTLFMFINGIFLIGGLYPSLGIANEMKVLIVFYTIPSIYICYSFGWIKMQVENVDEQLE
jgi:hypothetical protein